MRALAPDIHEELPNLKFASRDFFPGIAKTNHIRGESLARQEQ